MVDNTKTLILVGLTKAKVSNSLRALLKLAFCMSGLFEYMQAPAVPYINYACMEPKSGWRVPTTRNIALIQNPGWNKTTVNTFCRDAVQSLPAANNVPYLVDDMTEKSVFERMKKTQPVERWKASDEEFGEEASGSSGALHVGARGDKSVQGIP